MMTYDVLTLDGNQAAEPTVLSLLLLPGSGLQGTVSLGGGLSRPGIPQFLGCLFLTEAGKMGTDSKIQGESRKNGRQMS